ncbi:hypothetical protein D3C72_2107260 [compost metagenome]
MLHATGPQNQPLEGGKEVFLGIGEHVQAMRNAVIADIFDQRRFQVRVVMAVIERRTARQEVRIGLAVGAIDGGAQRPIEHFGKAA